MDVSTISDSGPTAVELSGLPTEFFGFSTMGAEGWNLQRQFSLSVFKDDSHTLLCYWELGSCNPSGKIFAHRWYYLDNACAITKYFDMNWRVLWR